MVYLPRLRAAAAVAFLVDTGADTTSVHWGDRESFVTEGGEPLPSSVQFESMSVAPGLTGRTVEYGVEPALFVFRDASGDAAHIDGYVRMALEPRIEGIPSLLGRDLLARMRLDFNMPANELALEW